MFNIDKGHKLAELFIECYWEHIRRYNVVLIQSFV